MLDLLKIDLYAVAEEGTVRMFGGRDAEVSR